MTEIEQFQFAAKAAGITGKWVTGYRSGDYGYCGNQDGILYELPHGGVTVWNPRDDDGAAFRLAVTLRLRIDHGNYETRVFQQWEDTALSLVEYGTDPLAATCLAIFLAAVEIGRSMP